MFTNKIQQLEYIQQDINLLRQHLPDGMRKKFILLLLNLEKTELELESYKNLHQSKQLKHCLLETRCGISHLLRSQFGGENKSITEEINKINNNLTKIKRQIDEMISENDITIGLFTDLIHDKI